jgi:glucose-6-phosphate dehydrogenase assembly protein OpcA
MSGPAGRAAASSADVDRQLAELWREAATNGQPVVRACSLNLVVVCADETGDLQRATALVGRIAETVPGRALVVGPPRAVAGEPLDVWVSAHCHQGDSGRQVCSEQVTIDPSRAALDHVPATVLQLLVEDMPVYTWWRRAELRGDPLVEPLVALSDHWIVDSAKGAAPAEVLRMLRALTARETWRGQVRDLAWARLEPWRDAVASFFDHSALRPALARLRRVEIVAGGPAGRHEATVAGAYLAGWLRSRLGRPAGASEPTVDFGRRGELSPGEVGSVTLEAGQGADAIVLRAALFEGHRDCLRCTAEAGDHRLPARRLELPALDEAALLCGVLQETGRDAVFETALVDAAGLV